MSSFPTHCDHPGVRIQREPPTTIATPSSSSLGHIAPSSSSSSATASPTHASLYKIERDGPECLSSHAASTMYGAPPDRSSRRTCRWRTRQRCCRRRPWRRASRRASTHRPPRGRGRRGRPFGDIPRGGRRWRRCRRSWGGPGCRRAGTEMGTVIF